MYNHIAYKPLQDHDYRKKKTFQNIPFMLE
jgi:hypothetical protein